MEQHQNNAGDQKVLITSKHSLIGSQEPSCNMNFDLKAVTQEKSSFTRAKVCLLALELAQTSKAEALLLPSSTITVVSKNKLMYAYTHPNTNTPTQTSPAVLCPSRQVRMWKDDDKAQDNFNGSAEKRRLTEKLMFALGTRLKWHANCGIAL